MQQEQSRRRRQQPPKMGKGAWRRFVRRWGRRVWRICLPLLWVVTIGSLSLGAWLTYQVTQTATPQASLTSMLATAKAQGNATGDQQFDTQLTQVQQLGLLARWGHAQASGSYVVYLGTANTILFDYRPHEADWATHTFKVIDHHDGTFSLYRPVAGAISTDPTSWPAVAAIAKSRLLDQYQDQLADYAARIDLSRRLQSSPTE